MGKRTGSALAIGLSMTRAPCASSPADKVIGAIYDPGVRRADQLTRCEARRRSLCAKALQPASVQFDIAIQNRNPLTARRAPAPIDRARESRVLTHLDHPAVVSARHLCRAVSRIIVDHHNLVERYRLPGCGGEQTLQQVRAIVNGDDRRNGGRDLGSQHSKL